MTSLSAQAWLTAKTTYRVYTCVSCPELKSKNAGPRYGSSRKSAYRRRFGAMHTIRCAPKIRPVEYIWKFVLVMVLSLNRFDCERVDCPPGMKLALDNQFILPPSSAVLRDSSEAMCFYTLLPPLLLMYRLRRRRLLRVHLRQHGGLHLRRKRRLRLRRPELVLRRRSCRGRYQDHRCRVSECLRRALGGRHRDERLPGKRV